MKIKLKKGDKLEIVGPASITLLEGNIDVLGSTMRLRESITIPLSRVAILTALEDSTLEVSVGEEGELKIIEKVPIPFDWREKADDLLNMDKPLSVLILGDVNSGKSIFANYLVNLSISKGFKTSLIDEDLGQSEISAPATIGLAIYRRPVPALFKAHKREEYFIGSTNPADFMGKVLVGISTLFNKAMRYPSDVIIVNTDGWISGRAVEFKQNLIEIIRPNVIVAIERKRELEPIIRPLEGQSWTEIVRLSALPVVRDRAPEERKVYREGMYRKYMQRARVRTFDLNRVKLLNTYLGSSIPLPPHERRRLEKIINRRIHWCGWYDKSLVMVLDSPLGREEISDIKRVLQTEDVIYIRKGQERGLIVGLLDSANTYLGMGVIDEIDFEKNAIKIVTTVDENPSLVVVGLVKLNNDFREIGKVRFPPF
ncbi:MAG: hypothetical protein DRJ49_04010 [Thermoprotei archaeon]|nr:MAG: hypothetical protein DRJ49_04010 [Thermoprotei archaeon]